MGVIGRTPRALVLAVLTACGIDARGQLAVESTTNADGGGGSGGNTDGGSTANDGGPSEDGSALVDGGPPPRTRVTNGLVALYEMEEGAGTVAHDSSGQLPALDLGVPNTVKWIPHALSFDVAAHVKSLTLPTKIVSRCTVSNAITIEAWIRYVGLPDWSRIVALSLSGDTGNAAMTSNPATIGFDLRTSSDAYLRTTKDVYDGGAPTALVHLVETRDAAGVKRVYLDGALTIDATQAGTFATWDGTYPLSVGNTPALDRPFFGEVHLVAIYDRALTAAEVATNRAAGADP